MGEPERVPEAGVLARWRATWRAADAGRIRLGVLQALPLAVSLAVAPGLLVSAVDLPKSLALLALVLAGWTATIFASAPAGAVRLPRTALDAPLGLWVGWGVVAAAAAVNPALARETAWRTAAVAWLAAQIRPAERGPLVDALVLAGGIQALYGILQYAGIDVLPWASSWGSRCFGTIGNPVFFAEFLAPLLVLAVGALVAEEDEERKDLFVLAAVAMFLALVFSQTRSAWVGSALGLAAAGAALARAPGGRERLARHRGFLLALGGGGLAVVLFISSPAILGRHALPLRDRVADMVNVKGWTVQHRLALWRAGGLMLRERPLLGRGPDHFGSAFPLVQASFRESFASRGIVFAPKEQRAHNDYVQLAAETGVVGLGLWFWVLACLFRAGARAVRAAGGPADAATAAGAFGGCVALAADALFNFPFQILPAAVVFWLLAGTLAGRGAVRTRAAAAAALSDPAGRRWLPAAAAAAALLGFAAVAFPAVRADRARAAGEASLASNMVEMAEVHFEESLRYRPHDPLLHYQRGVALDRAAAFDWTGRTWDKALNELRRAEALGLHDELLYSRLSLLFEKKGSIPKAIRDGDLARRIYPEFPDHASNLAYWLSRRGVRLDEALALADRAVASVPVHPLYRWTRGLVLERLGRHREALAAMREALPLLVNVQNGAAYRPDLERDIARVASAARARRG
jgi:O-antigen ligase/Flp pilus assembly protein TadD